MSQTDPTLPTRERMRILLVVPPWRTTDRLTSQLFPMPLAAVQLAAVLRDAGHDVAVRDFLLPAASSSTPAPAGFKGLSAPAYRHYGTPLDDALAWLSANAPDYDAIGLCACQCNVWETAAAIGQHVKALGLPLVVGGPFATTAPGEVREKTGADVVVKGEGEVVVVEAFVRAVAGETRVTLEGEKADITELPLPAWDLAPPSGYPKHGSRIRGVLTISRGCPWDCSFCSVHTIMGRKHRRLSAFGIAEQVRHLASFGVRYFCFLDDNLLISPKAVDELLETLAGLRKELPELRNARFYVEEGIEIRIAAKPGILRRLAEARFDNLGLGLETMSSARRADARKPYSDAELEAAIAEAKGAGVTARAFYIVGFPDDTLASVCDDLVEFAATGLEARPNNLKLYPGTEATRVFRERGYIGDDYDWRLSSFHTPTSTGLSYPQIRKLKTVLGALGSAAAAGFDPYRATVAELVAGLKTQKLELRLEAGKVRITGRMFRNTAWRYLSEALLLRQGAPGARSRGVEDGVEAWTLEEPSGDIQGALSGALARAGLAAWAPDLEAAPEPEHDPVLDSYDVELVHPDEVSPWKRNPRRNDRAAKALADWLKRSIWTVPMLVDSEGVLVAGHTRLKAAFILGLKRVPIIRLPVAGEEARRLALSDNRLGEIADWDEEELDAILREIETHDGSTTDLNLMGWSDADLLSAHVGASKPKPTSPLTERFVVPPLSILDTRQGYWSARRQLWMGLGIESELGRGSAKGGAAADGLLLHTPAASDPRFYPRKREVEAALGRELSTAEFLADHYKAPEEGTGLSVSGTSVFDPVLCELVYRWFGPGKGAKILDPFAGGSVRGVVAGALGHQYVGVELRPEQVAANRGQWATCSDPLAGDLIEPIWLAGDSRELPELVPEEDFDLVFSCPPYFDLEVYSDDERDLSAAGDYAAFVDGYSRIIDAAVEKLRPNRFAVFVVSDVRDPGGIYRGLVRDTIRLLEDAGANLYNEAILVNTFGSLPMRAARTFPPGRKLGRTHQHVIVAFNGDPSAIRAEFDPIDVALPPGMVPGEGSRDSGGEDPAGV